MTSHRCVPGRDDSAKKHHVYYSFQVVLTTRNDIKIEKREKELTLVGFKRNYFKFVDPGERIFT